MNNPRYGQLARYGCHCFLYDQASAGEKEAGEKETSKAAEKVDEREERSEGEGSGGFRSSPRPNYSKTRLIGSNGLGVSVRNSRKCFASGGFTGALSVDWKRLVE